MALYLEQAILNNSDVFAQTARTLLDTYGVDVYSTPYEGGTIRSALLRRGDRNAEAWSGVASTGTSVVVTLSAATGPLAIAAASIAGFLTYASLSVAEAVEAASCMTKARNRRDELNNKMGSIVQKFGGDNAVAVRLREAFPIATNVIEDVRGPGGIRVTFASWGPYTPNQSVPGLTWTDGSRTPRKGVDEVNSAGCSKYASMEAFRNVARDINTLLTDLNQIERLQFLVGFLGLNLGSFGDPTIGLRDVLQPLARYHRAEYEYVVIEEVAHRTVRRSDDIQRRGSLNPLVLLGGAAAAFYLLR